MNNYSQETLRRIEHNHDTLTEMGICNDSGCVTSDGRYFTSRDGNDYSRLGNCIGNNTNLKILNVKLQGIRLSATDGGFFEGIKQNSSIEEFKLSGFSRSDQNYPIGRVGCKLLKAFHESNNLTTLHIWCCDIGSFDERIIIKTTLSSCTNLKEIHLSDNSMTDEQLLPIVEGLQLMKLSLHTNRIGNAGCDALATLLRDPCCNIHILDLRGNQIGNDGAIAIANSLASNNKLKKLDLRGNRMDDSPKIVEDAISRVLCNTTSLNATHSSNHTLSKIKFNDFLVVRMGIELVVSLDLNRGINKKYVAIKKILRYHPNIDMEQLFEWGSGVGVGVERNLMALPYVIDWFDRAGEAVEYCDDSSDSDAGLPCYHYKVEEKKLTAIYEFALAMPILFIPSSDKKRKRVT